MIHVFKSIAQIVVVLLAAMLLLGCSSYRPTEVIRTTADRHFAKDAFETASSEYAEIIDRYPGDWRAQYRYGQCQLELGNPADARRAFEIAHTARPNDPEVADALAESLFALEEHDQLFAFLRERSTLTQSVHSYLRLADFATRLGDPDTARLSLDTAIRINEDRSIEPYIAAADFAQQLGDLDLAVRRLTQAYFLNPRDQRVKDMLLELGEVPGPTLAMPEQALDGSFD